MYKNCGIPFYWTTIDDAREYFEVRVMRGQQFMVRCRKCDAASMFLEGDTRASQAMLTF